jgi:hypothetical protein
MEKINFMEPVQKNDFDTWTIEKGDYINDTENSEIYYKEILLRRRIRQLIFTILYFCAVSLFTYFILRLF